MASKSYDSESPVDLFEYMALFRSASSLLPSIAVACGNFSMPCCATLHPVAFFVAFVVVAVVGCGGGARGGKCLAESSASDLLLMCLSL